MGIGARAQGLAITLPEGRVVAGKGRVDSQHLRARRRYAHAACRVEAGGTHGAGGGERVPAAEAVGANVGDPCA